MRCQRSKLSASHPTPKRICMSLMRPAPHIDPSGIDTTRRRRTKSYASRRGCRRPAIAPSGTRTACCIGALSMRHSATRPLGRWCYGSSLAASLWRRREPCWIASFRRAIKISMGCCSSTSFKPSSCVDSSPCCEAMRSKALRCRRHCRGPWTIMPRLCNRTCPRKLCRRCPRKHRRLQRLRPALLPVPLHRHCPASRTWVPPPESCPLLPRVAWRGS
mmetsp:Transcript_26624/g.58174  ORF Transcript_26624/g.58174 Transcript_26624/m.58174 type:complete len:218 (+) Transcript_26624:61-714(+)